MPQPLPPFCTQAAWHMGPTCSSFVIRFEAIVTPPFRPLDSAACKCIQDSEWQHGLRHDKGVRPGRTASKQALDITEAFPAHHAAASGLAGRLDTRGLVPRFVQRGGMDTAGRGG